MNLNLGLQLEFMPFAGNSYLQLKARPCCPSPACLLHSPGWWNNIHPRQSSACWGCRSEWCTGCWTAGVGGSPWARCKSGWAGNHLQRLAHFWWFWWHWRCACCTWWCRPVCPEGHAWSPSRWCLRGEKSPGITQIVKIRQWMSRICWVTFMEIFMHFSAPAPSKKQAQIIWINLKLWFHLLKTIWIFKKFIYCIIYCIYCIISVCGEVSPVDQ